MLNKSNSQAPTQNEQTITSLEISKISNMRHRDLLRSIRQQEVAWRKVNGRSFALVEYQDAKGEKRPMYKLSRMESLYISSKFNDYQRAKLVMRWYELEIQAPQPINDVYPMFHKDKVGYPRKELLISVGRSFKNGYRLRHRFPGECFNIGRTACVSEKLAHYLVAEYNVRQLEMDFAQQVEGGDHE